LQIAKQLVELSKLSKGSKEFESLRTIVPRIVVKNMNLKLGDHIELEMQNVHGEIFYIVRKATDSKK
jgi:antitoxin component of MazEF toxin-antitoxin module